MLLCWLHLWDLGDMRAKQTGNLSLVPNMPQQRSDQHHPPGTPTMMHPATAAGPPIVAPNPAYPAQYFTCSPQQFASQPLVQQMTHYQSQVGFAGTLLFVFAHLNQELLARPAWQGRRCVEEHMQPVQSAVLAAFISFSCSVISHLSGQRLQTAAWQSASVRPLLHHLWLAEPSPAS